jgi:tetratricopeptide (TPR) repeat protein
MSDARELIQRAYALRRKGERTSSLKTYREACNAFGEDDEGRAHCLRHVGDLARELGYRDEARAALQEAEALYRGPVNDPLALANTVRLLALLDDDTTLWTEARSLYQHAALKTGMDLEPALRECDGHLEKP